jgi:phosphoenolpyruvate synthase/pyruvate phosphate dikinase
MMKIKKGLIAKGKKFIQKNQWYHQRFDGCPHFILVISEAELKKEPRKFPWGNCLTHWGYFENDRSDWYIDQRDINRITGQFIKLSKTENNLSHKIIQRWDQSEKKFYQTCRQVSRLKLSGLSDDKLKEVYLKMLNQSIESVSSSSIIDGFALGTDNYILNSLKVFLRDKGLERQLQRYFEILTAPVHQSFMAQSEVELLKIGQKIKQKKTLFSYFKGHNLKEATKRIKSDKNLFRFLNKHQQKYFWIRNNYVDHNILTVDFFIKELAAILKSRIDLAEEIKRLSLTPVKNRRAKAKLLKELNLPKPLKDLLIISEDFTKWQDERKKKTYWYNHHLSLILEEIAKRVGFTVHQLKYLNYPELLNLFEKNKLTKVSPQEAEQRIKSCIWYQKGDLFEQFSGNKANALKDEFLKKYQQQAINDFRGMSASKGVARGRVCIVKSVKDGYKVKKGQVLVAIMTRPDYVPMMKKAVAVVTNEGGVTCHAAIVSRELGIPCVIGTKIATEVLKDGDLVEVNANHGVVKIIK